MKKKSTENGTTVWRQQRRRRRREAAGQRLFRYDSEKNRSALKQQQKINEKILNEESIYIILY